MVKLSAQLFRAWNENGIRYCHWKSTNHLDAAMEGVTDLDILVDVRQAADAETIATQLGYIRVQTDPLRSYPGVLDLVGIDDSTGSWIHLHLHYQLVLGDRWVKATWLPIEDSVLRRALYDEEYSSFVVSPHDELYLFCARMALKHRRPFDLDYVWRELKHIQSRVASAKDQTQPRLPPFESLNRLVGSVQAEETPSRARLNKMAKEAARSLTVVRRYGGGAFVILSFLRKVYRYWVEFRRRILRRFDIGRRSLATGGRIIAFVGIDGSGKTSALHRTERFFAQQLNVASVFLGSGRSGASWYRKLVFTVLGSRASFTGHKELRRNSVAHGVARIPWYYAVWTLITTYDKRQNLRRAMAARANGALVLSDRWPQGQIPGTLDGPRLIGRPSLSRLARHVAKREEELIRLAEVARPDLVIRFRVTPNVALSRKPGELTDREANRNARLLDEIQWTARQVVDIDADAPVEHVDRQIRNAIWETLRGAR